MPRKSTNTFPEQAFLSSVADRQTNGMAIDSTGCLVVCEQGSTNQVVQMDTLGVVKKILVNRYNSKAFRQPE